MTSFDDRQSAGRGNVLDVARMTMHRCGQRWVVEISSPRLGVEVTLDEMSSDPDAAIEELLCKIGDACAEVSIGAEGETCEPDYYEWRVEFTRWEAQVGDLGIALFAALSAQPHQHNETGPRRQSRARRCTETPSSRAVCRPLRF
jgi:hypothetical protein